MVNLINRKMVITSTKDPLWKHNHLKSASYFVALLASTGSQISTTCQKERAIAR